MANRFLGLLMFIYSLLLVQMLLTDLDYNQKFPHLFFAFLGLPFLISPLHYLYAKSLINFSRHMNKLDWLHFLPFAIIELYFLQFIFQTNSNAVILDERPQILGVPVHFIIYNWIIIFQGMTYLILTIILINKYSSNIKDVFSNIEKIKLNWLKIITFMVIFVLTFFMIENLLMIFDVQLSYHFSLTSLLYAILVYVLGYIGLSKSEIFSAPELAISMNQMQIDEKFNATNFSNAKDDLSPKYEKSGLNPQKAEEYLKSLLKLMEEEKPYRDSELTLPKLAEKLNITPHNLSEVINTRLNQNFFDFINHYRVEEVKRALKDPEKQHLTILSIAFDAGFNSKTAFNTVFKKHTGVTPSEFRSKFLK